MNYKALVGKTVYLIPTGNMIERGNGGALNQIKEARVTKKSRVFVTLEVKHSDTFQQEKKCRINEIKPDLVTIDDFNGGYQVFVNKAELDKHVKANRARGKLVSCLHDLSDNELCKIADALEWQLPELN